MSSHLKSRRLRSVSPTSTSHSYRHYDHDYEGSHRHYDHDYEGSHRHDRRKHHSSPFTMDLLKTAVTALSDAVVAGRDDGQHHQHHRHYHDDQSLSILAPRSKTADQVYDTFLQAAYTLGEIVGDLERMYGISKKGNEDEGYGGRSRSERHGSRRIEDLEDYEHWDGRNVSGHNDGYNNGYYDGDGTAGPVPGGHRDYPDIYSREGRYSRPHPLRRASSNPEFEFEPPHRDDLHDSRSPRRRTAKSPPPRKDLKSHRERSRSRASSSSSSHEGTRKRIKSKAEMILDQLPGLISRGAFILELMDLDRKHKQSTGMAAKYSALLMALKLVKQLKNEYRGMAQRQEAKKERKGK